MPPKNTVPDGWQDFTNMGTRLPGTRFVPFKVPLKNVICCKIPSEQWFTPKDVLEQLPQLKLVINLTNAKMGRYYFSRDFEDEGVKVVQIMCEGRGMLPPAKKLQLFYDAVDDFLRQGDGSDDLIGVHCTHGLNRTGYFICKYLIEKLNKTPDEAIALFEAARGHPIERHQYTNNLRVRNIQEKSKAKPVSKRPRRRYYHRESRLENWRERNYVEDNSYHYGGYNEQRYHSRVYSRANSKGRLRSAHRSSEESSRRYCSY